MIHSLRATEGVSYHTHFQVYSSPPELTHHKIEVVLHHTSTNYYYLLTSFKKNELLDIHTYNTNEFYRYEYSAK